jgi:four helix bundle protein
MSYGLWVTSGSMLICNFIITSKPLFYDKKISCFEDLIIWQNAQDIAVKIYKLVEGNEFIRKDFSLKDQFKSAALSISDNIAEGFEYNNNPDFHRFLRISKGSCGENRNKIHFTVRLGFISEEIANNLLSEAIVLGKQIGELMKKVKHRIKLSKSQTTMRNS